MKITIDINEKLQDIWEENTKYLLSDSHGQYIPKVAMEMLQNAFITTSKEETGVVKCSGSIKQIVETYDDLQNPENEHYWESWDNFMDMIEVVSAKTNKTYQLYQNGDVWLIDYDNLTLAVNELARVTGEDETDLIEQVFPQY